MPDLPIESYSPPLADAALCIDCEECEFQHTAHCDDCLVSYLIGFEQDEPVMLDEDERHAVDLLAEAGLVPPSRFSHRAGSA